MMRFEELDVRKMSFELTKELGSIFYDFSFKNWSFQDQIMRASLSIGNNIAEGFERNNKKEFAVFLRYAKGSCGEVRQMLYIAQEFGYISLEQAEKMRTSCVLLSIKLYKLYKSL